ncbi:glycoside hydrolase family 19 protein, partial [Brucella anthropi]
MHLGDTRLLIEAGRERGLLRNQMAYVLATAYHETAHTMKPVNEMGGEKYLRAKKYWPFIGRGYVQITWRSNYERASKKLGVDFVKKPELLLKPEYAAPIIIAGMVEGWFTGKKLSDYITLQ